MVFARHGGSCDHRSSDQAGRKQSRFAHFRFSCLRSRLWLLNMSDSSNSRLQQNISSPLITITLRSTYNIYMIVVILWRGTFSARERVFGDVCFAPILTASVQPQQNVAMSQKATSLTRHNCRRRLLRVCLAVKLRVEAVPIWRTSGRLKSSALGITTKKKALLA
jgi:hypothetical protein